jgi:actin related protein 2/3 complex subunit 2
MPPPLYLEFQNRIVYTTLCEKITAEKPDPVDITIADFNQVLWHLISDETMMTVSVSTKCFPQLQKYATPHLKTVYGPLLIQAEPKYDISVKFSLATPPDDAKKNPDPFASKIALLARNVMAGPFLYMFDQATKRAGQGEQLQVDYRSNESLWLKNEGDRIICIFSIYFDDPDDIVIGRVFLQEIGKLVQGAPAVDTHLKDPPRELAAIKNLKAHGYCSFLLESRHFAPKQRDTTINFLVQFRNYIHYHLKCSKAYLHIRMRNRVSLLLQILNRAKQERKATGALMFGFRK